MTSHNSNIDYKLKAIKPLGSHYMWLIWQKRKDNYKLIYKVPMINRNVKI